MRNCLYLVLYLLVIEVKSEDDYPFKSFIINNFTLENLDGSMDGYERVTVETHNGNIHGRSKADVDQKIVSFLGIPYALPPIGSLRFLPPQPVKMYQDLKAFKFGDTCIQSFGAFMKMIGSEDCLTLNIFTNTEDFSVKKPVMVWIHGGSYVIGTGRTYNPAPLIKKDVVVVTINYRLDIFGFLTFGNDIAPGNLATRDQIEALKWVQDYISYFGGNPNKVTIFGSSAGGMSTNTLQLSPAAAGLFTAAIHQSGTALLSRADFEVSKLYRVAQELANLCNAPSKALDSSLLEHLQNVEADYLLRVSSSSHNFWTPSPDGYLSNPILPLNFLQAMLHGLFNRVPTMSGTITSDGGLNFNFLDVNEYLKYFGPIFLGRNLNITEALEDQLCYLETKNIYKYYNGDNYNLLEVLPGYIKMKTDALFLGPDQKVAELVSKHAPMYNYQFTYAGSNTRLNEHLSQYTIKEALEKVSGFAPFHGDELLYLFDLVPLESADDLKMREVLTQYWTNFAKYHNPSPPQENTVIRWYPYLSDKNYMILNLEPKMDRNIEEERMVFWQQVHWNVRECKDSYISETDKSKFEYFDGVNVNQELP